MGAFAYADDIILLATTKQSMHGMLKLANMFSKEYNIKFNELKVVSHPGSKKRSKI